MLRGEGWAFIALLAWRVASGGETGTLDARVADAAMVGDLDAVHALVKRGADVNGRGAFGTPALHWRVRVDDLTGAKLLLAAGADANGTTERGVTPLQLAIDNGNAAMVALLLKSRADANGPGPTGETPLMRAAEVGVLPVVQHLLKAGAVVDYREGNYGQTALMFAARAGHADVVAALLGRGANPNVATIVGATPAFIAPNSVPGFGFGVGILRGGVPADRGRREPTPGGMTPLLYAARHDRVEVARLLIKGGADVNAREANGIWPLLMAISNDNMAVAQLLLEHGSAVNGQDWYGRSPLWEAVNVRNLYVHNATFKNGIERAPVLELIGKLLACRGGRECADPRDPAISQPSPGDHRVPGMGGFHRPDPVPDRRAGRRRHRDETAAGTRGGSAHRHLRGHLAADGRGRRQLGAGADLDRGTGAAAGGGKAVL